MSKIEGREKIMIYKGLELHNIQEVIEKDGTSYLSRLPHQLQETIGHEKGFQMTGVEIRLVPKGRVKIHMGSHNPYIQSKALIMYDGHYDVEEVLINENTVVDIFPVEKFTETFKENVEVRVVLTGEFIFIDKVEGEFDLFKDERKRYLAYGTSITQGLFTNCAEGAYPYILGRNLDYEVHNYAMSGMALCEDVTADFLVDQGEFDLITLELSVNMFALGFSLAEFRKRTHALITKLKNKSPNTNIYCIGMMQFYNDLGVKHPENLSTETIADYRSTYKEMVASFNDERIIYVEAKDLLSISNLCVDLIHPSSSGMYEIAYKLTDIIKNN